MLNNLLQQWQHEIVPTITEYVIVSFCWMSPLLKGNTERERFGK